MFKSLRLFRISPEWVPPSVADLEPPAFVECGPTQQVSMGWIAPRGKSHAELIDVVGGQWLMRLMVEQKTVPGSVIARRVKALADQIEQQTGRKPGRKESKELKGQALLDLLPQAFPKQAAIWVWISPEQRMLAIDGATASLTDDIISMLVGLLPGFSVQPLHTTESPAAVMSAWLMDGEPPAPFTVDRECELKSPDETKSTVRYTRHGLDADNVREHIKAGKRPTKLALSYAGRISFVLTDMLAIKKIEILDIVFAERDAAGDAEASFDADVAIATGELSRLIPDLVEALGGEPEEVPK